MQVQIQTGTRQSRHQAGIMKTLFSVSGLTVSQSRALAQLRTDSSIVLVVDAYR